VEPPRPQRRKTIVIADDGARAVLVLFDAAQLVADGLRFKHDGRAWVVRGARGGSGLLVATPAEGPRF
jgi:hypothetical protein